MPTETLHDWNLEPTEAIALQKRLATRIEREDRLAAVRHIAGVDIGFEQGGENNTRGGGGAGLAR